MELNPTSVFYIMILIGFLFSAIFAFADTAPAERARTSMGGTVALSCRGRLVRVHTLDRLVQEGRGRPRIPPRGQAEIDHLTIGIDGAPEVAPLAADANAGLIHCPAGHCEAMSREGTCRSTLARRGCVSVRLVGSGPNLRTQRYTVDRSSVTPRSAKMSTTSR